MTPLLELKAVMSAMIEWRVGEGVSQDSEFINERSIVEGVGRYVHIANSASDLILIMHQVFDLKTTVHERLVLTDVVIFHARPQALLSAYPHRLRAA